MNETKIFKRYLSKYLLVVLLVILGSIPFVLMAYKHIRNYTISENVSKLESGIKELENNMDKMQMISFMLNDDQNIRMLKRIEGEITTNKLLNLKYLSNEMFSIQCIYDFSSMFFVMFKNNDAFASTGQVSGDFSQYYDQFFDVTGMTSSEFKNTLFNEERKSSFILVNQIKYYLTNKEKNAKNAILYVQPIEVDKTITTNKAVIVYIIDEKKMIETLLTQECLEQGILRVTDGAGNLIVNYGEDADKFNNITESEYIKIENRTYKVLSYNNIKDGLQVTVGFPMELINHQMRDILRLLCIYAGIGILLALILTTVFSMHWYGPIGNMIKVAVKIENNNSGKKNEYDYVRESLIKLASTKDELEAKILLANAQKQAIMLENVFIKGFYKKEEEEEFIKQFPFVKDGYYVVYLQISSPDEIDQKQTALVTAIEIFESYFGEKFIHVHSITDTAILLIPVIEGMDKERIKEIFITISGIIMQQFQVLNFVGISQKEAEIANINIAYSQARQTVHAYKNMNTSFVEFYQYIIDAEKGCFNIGFLNKLYELILCSERKEIEHLFHEIREECTKYKERYEFQKAEIYHAISFVNYTAYQQLSCIPKKEIKLKKYQQNHSLIQCLDILEQSSYEICDKIDELKKSKNIELRNKIIQYLTSNFKRVELTTDLVSKEVGITEKYLSAFLKEHIGKTFSVYLDELRIQYSKECLESTNWSNDKIAKEAGFGATNSFYRVFKKYVGVSPSVYKKSKLVMME